MHKQHVTCSLCLGRFTFDGVDATKNPFLKSKYGMHCGRAGSGAFEMAQRRGRRARSANSPRREGDQMCLCHFCGQAMKRRHKDDHQQEKCPGDNSPYMVRKKALVQA